MISSRYYDTRNVKRAKNAKVAVVAGAVILCGYLVLTSVLSIRQVWDAERTLGNAKQEAAQLSREAAAAERQEARRTAPSGGGLETFAVVLSDWAKRCGVRVESYSPEGSSLPSEIEADGVKLGVWNASKVRIKGEADYSQLLALLEDFRNTSEPVRLDSFSLQASQANDSRLRIDFELQLTVYEKKSGAS